MCIYIIKYVCLCIHLCMYSYTRDVDNFLFTRIELFLSSVLHAIAQENKAIPNFTGYLIWCIDNYGIELSSIP